MTSLAVVVRLDVGEQCGPQAGQGGPRSWVYEFFFDGPEEGFCDGVVVTDPGLSDRGRTLFLVQNVRTSPLVYWLPRSEWKMTPAGGLRFFTAMSRASTISVVRMWSAIHQPTTLRE